MDRLSALAACTVVSKNHLAYARVVCESFTKQHPGARFYVLLADRIEGEFSPRKEGFELIELEHLPVPDLPRFCFQYDILELNCAAKPYLMRHLLQQPGISKLLYLDSDTFVYRELTEVLELLEQHSIVLTPHLVREAEEDGRKPGERHIMESGVYNAGFLGLRNGPDTERFLAWWSGRIYDKCIRDTRQGLFVDQRWLDLVPGLFDGVHILRNPAYNVGHWGLTHRQVEAHEDGARVDGASLAFFHFSGLDVERPEAISQHQDRFSLADVPALKPVFEDYVTRVKAAGHAECQRWPYAYARFGNGVPIPQDARRLYWSLGGGVRRFGNPFDTRGDGSFWNWMRQDAHAGSGISRFWNHVHASRPDLQRAFPDPFGKDRLPFLTWIVATGRMEHAVPEALVPPGPPLVAEPPSRQPGAAREDVPGVNVAGGGHPAEEAGDAMRALVRGLTAGGVPYRLVDAGDENPYPVNLLLVDAAALPRFVGDRGPQFFRGKYNVGCWAWDQPELPEAFRGAFAYLDEVWVSSDDSLQTVSRLSPVPVINVPLALPPDAVGARIRERLAMIGRDPAAPGSIFRE